ncbi:hypothetical protein PT277_05895 [Acetobacteraceae bacterium ESL0709]|nr:hypothetical protein [Acetobacteraceae bacterium ESL0697]MDF7678230.1 hypothetical protein [Acetobacteraceae bacterium ESL0709]
MRRYSGYGLALVSALAISIAAPASFANEAQTPASKTTTTAKTSDKPADKKEAAKPVGHIHFKTHSADLGVGYTWGEGTLTFHGKTHRFSISGGNIAALGFASIDASGDVFNLKHLHDFDGEYGSIAGEATVDEGVGGALVSNSNGVHLKITTSNRGARLAAGLQGLKFTLKD